MIDTLSREALAVTYDGADYDGRPVQVGASRLVAVPALEPRAAAGSHPFASVAPVARPASLRITRRGRLVLVVAVSLLVLVAFSVGRVMSNASSGQPAPQTHTVVVGPGDSAWSIARAAMPKLDGRDAVDRLLALNHSDGRLQVGQTLLVPGS